MGKFVQQYPIVAFFVLAYVFTWLLEGPAAFFPRWPGLLSFLGALGPAAAAIVVVAVAGAGRLGLRQLLAPLGRWRVGVHWYAIVLLGPALMMLASVFIYGLLFGGSGMRSLNGVWPMLGQHAGALAILFAYQFLIVWGEEIGWRGYALPRLQERYHPFLASVILGLVWGLWHLPSFWMEGSIHQRMSLAFFVLTSVGYSLLYTWAYNGSRGSLLLMTLLHAANNTTVTYTILFFPALIEKPVFSLAVLALFDLLVILISGPRLLWRPAEPPEPADLPAG